MSDKIQNSFYLLKEEINIFNTGTRKYVPQTIDFAYLEKFFKGRKYKEQAVQPNLSQQYELRLFYKRNSAPVKWKGFMATIADANADILKHPLGQSESYILVFFNKTTKQYFASTGGYGHIDTMIVATNDLGIEILSRIVTAEDKALRSTKERSISGGIAGSVKFFRSEYNLYDNESFGTVYNELCASLDKKKLVNLFGFAIADLRSDNLCIAKNSFSIKKSVSFKELLRIIESCETILKKPPIVEINSVVKIDRKNTALINSLNDDLDKLVFANYKKAADFFSVEISHKEFEKYFQSEQTKLSFSVDRKLQEKTFDTPIREVQTILDEIRAVNPKLTRKDFETVMETGHIKTVDADDTVLTEEVIRNHYCSEIKQGLQSYFLIERDWYEVSKSMIDKINTTCANFVKEKKYTGPVMHPWDKTFTSENAFNASFIGKANTLVFDKITPSNIEVCDIVSWDKDNVYLYHVKKGFNNSMRDLCGQVAIAARKVLEDKKSKFDFIGSLYDSLQANGGQSPYITNAKAQLGKITRADFIDLFKDRKIVFVLAVLDTSNKARTLESNMNDYDSNIAKFSLNELTLKMRNLEVTFEILQLSS